MLTIDEVIDGFRLVLKRHPGSDSAIEHFRAYDHVGPFLIDLINSEEYGDVRRRRKAPDLSEYAFIDKGAEKAGINVMNIYYNDGPYFTVIVSNEAHLDLIPESPVCVDITVSNELKDAGEVAWHKKIGQRRLGHLMQYLGPHISSFARRNAFRLAFDFGDAGTAGFISMDRPVGTDWPLMPDIYLFEAARASIKRFNEIEFTEEFRSRIPKLFWRGGTTGALINSEHELFENYRVKCCQAIRDNAGNASDCKISRISQVGEEVKDIYASALTARGIFGDSVNEDVFTKYMMYVDLPGNTAGWGTCLKYLGGCLVFRPPQVRELAYSGLLSPWEHYIPVEVDMSNVGERVTWVLNNLEAATNIAWRGHCLLHDFVSNMNHSLAGTFESCNQIR